MLLQTRKKKNHSHSQCQRDINTVNVERNVSVSIFVKHKQRRLRQREKKHEIVAEPICIVSSVQSKLNRTEKSVFYKLKTIVNSRIVLTEQVNEK